MQPEEARLRQRDILAPFQQNGAPSEPAVKQLSADSSNELIRQESLFGRLPLLPGEREYGTFGAHNTCFAYAVATWCFLTGSK